MGHLHEGGIDDGGSWAPSSRHPDGIAAELEQLKRDKAYAAKVLHDQSNQIDNLKNQAAKQLAHDMGMALDDQIMKMPSTSHNRDDHTCTTLKSGTTVPVPKAGNTTRQVSWAIDRLFQGERVLLQDHFKGGKHKDANRNLLEMVLRRLKLEHGISVGDRTSAMWVELATGLTNEAFIIYFPPSVMDIINTKNYVGA